MSNRVAGSWKKKITATEIIEERDKCTFDRAEALKHIMDEETYEQLTKFGWMQKDPILKNSYKFYEMSREEQMVDWYKKIKRAFDINPALITDMKLDNVSWMIFMLGQSPISMHTFMFKKIIEIMATDEQ